MAAKTVSAIITSLISAAAVVLILFMMLLVMNGYSESDAGWGLGAFALLALMLTGLFSTAAFFLVGRLIKRGFGGAVAGLIAVLLCSVLTVIFEVIASFVGVGVAEYVRKHH
jgi:hypothetical protein